MRNILKFGLLVAAAIAGFAPVSKADQPQSDYARVMSAMSDSDDGSDPNSGTTSNNPSTPSVQQPISIYGPQAFHQTQGASSLSSASSAASQTFNARPGFTPNH